MPAQEDDGGMYHMRRVVHLVLHCAHLLQRSSAVAVWDSETSITTTVTRCILGSPFSLLFEQLNTLKVGLTRFHPTSRDMRAIRRDKGENIK